MEDTIKQIIVEEKQNIRNNMMKNYNSMLSTQISIVKLPNFKKKERKMLFDFTVQNTNYANQLIIKGFSIEDSEKMNKTIHSILNEYSLNLVNKINEDLIEKLKSY